MAVTENLLISLLLLHSCYYSSFFVEFATATDTITFDHSIKGSETLISNGGVFELGFFSPLNSTNRYLGIWYSFSPNVVVWVANRDKPLRDNSNGILKISVDGNLFISDAKGLVLWSSSNSTASSETTMASNNSSTSAQLLDSGNLVLIDYQGTTIWESFLHPCDTFLPKMRLNANSKRHSKVQVTSWKSISDPSTGSFSVGLESQAVPENFIWKGDRPYWRSGPWNGQYFLGAFDMNLGYHGFIVVDNKEGTVYRTLHFVQSFTISRFVLDWQGQVALKYWSSEKKDWEVQDFVPKSCGVYGTCGAFGSCYGLSSPKCICLRGFEPSNIQEWNRGNWTSGCVRRRPLHLQCKRLSNSTEGTEAAHRDESEDRFLKFKVTKVPDFMILSSAPREKCQEECLKNCSCTAYAFDSGIGCMLWSGNLIDLQQYPKGTGSDIYIRLAHSELSKGRQLAKTITIAVSIGTIVIATGAYFLYMWIYKKGVRKQKGKVMHSPGFKGIESLKCPGGVRLFNFERLAMATNSFHSDTMLGQGGFGQVYRGKLEDGEEIAVKRLSRASGQGVVEFMNEVVVISELQHRNLVKLLGCCVDGEEKMLIYEYLPNKSLDAFVFDPRRKELLDWRKRFNIIQGIGRGLLYLHRDSRLKIIHRDLKPSNILLDEELNPKISDFGMAKIFQGHEDHANTRRVVGTYGYMSPEYAFDGLFSEKSDVFSFGILLLGIVSGRRNSSFHQDEEYSSLLKFAWKLWNENNIIALADPSLSLCNQYFDENEIKRCLQVGLLCVQESARSRPSMPSVVSMLNSEIVDLPTPNKPAFIDMHSGSNTGTSSQLNQGKCTINNASITTTIDGR